MNLVQAPADTDREPSAARQVPLLIVGGGIGGLATALAVARTGQPVLLIEQAPEFTEIGAGLQIGANATRVMDRLGILEQVEAVAVHPQTATMRDALTGAKLTGLTLGETYRQHYGYPYLVMHRSDLLQILLEACQAEPLVTLENNRTVVDVASSVDHAIVTCADGTIIEAEVVIGADGIRSRLRTLFTDAAPVCSGFVAYRGTMPIDEVATDVDANDIVLWIGPDLHLMQYPVRAGSLYNQVAVFRSDTFSSGAEQWGTPEELDEVYAPTVDPVRLSAASTMRNRHWPLYDNEPLDTFVHERVVLIGDAAHAMLQVLGQGACQALEDAICLADALTEHPDRDKALAVYEEARLPHTTRCQRTARPWAEVWHLTDPVAIALRNRYLATRSDDDYTEVDWLYAATPTT